jgi:hypothetical protein
MCDAFNPLTKEQAQRIKLVLKTKQIEDVFVGHLFDVVAKVFKSNTGTFY